jgi:hypothetical protein
MAARLVLMTICVKTGNCMILLLNFTKSGQLYLQVSAVESEDVTDTHTVFVTLYNSFTLIILHH